MTTWMVNVTICMTPVVPVETEYAEDARDIAEGMVQGNIGFWTNPAMVDVINVDAQLPEESEQP